MSKDERFEGIEVEGYAVAGTSAASDLGIADAPTCARCGAALTHVFATSHGALGGDCLATITGDQSTRSIVRKVERVIGGDVGMSRIYVTRDTGNVLAITVAADRYRSTSIDVSASSGSLAYAVLRWYVDGGRGVKVVRGR